MRTILILAFIALNWQVCAQQIEIYFAKGDVVLEQNGKQVTPKEGTKLESNAKVTLGNKSMLVLYQGEKAVVLKEANTYTYAQLQDLLKNTKRGVGDRYIAYIWNKAHEKDDGDDDEGEGTLGVTGMVSRGEGGINAPQDSVICLSNKLPVELADDLAPAYIFIYDRKKPLLVLEASQQVYQLQFGGDLVKGKWYGLAASIEKQAPFAGIRYFKWATDDEVMNYHADFSSLLSIIEDFPEEQKNELIAAYFKVNRYVQVLE